MKRIELDNNAKQKINEYIQELIESTQEEYKKLSHKENIDLLDRIQIKIAALQSALVFFEKYDWFLTDAERDIIFNDVFYEAALQNVKHHKDSIDKNLSEEMIEAAAYRLTAIATRSLFSYMDVRKSIEEIIYENREANDDEEVVYDMSAASDEQEYYG